MSGAKPKHPTTLRLLYDDKYLYAGFECQDLDAASSVAVFDGPVAEQEHVSLCLDAGSATTGYFVIDVAPTGAVHDAYMLHGGRNAANKILTCWNCEKLRASVSVYGGGAQPGTQDRFWTVEIAITVFRTGDRAALSPGERRPLACRFFPHRAFRRAGVERGCPHRCK